MKLCECGCGSPAPLAKWSDPKTGVRKGEPQRFVHGHHTRKRHALSDVDVEARTAICLSCGPVRITSNGRKAKERWRWRCANAQRTSRGHRKTYHAHRGPRCERCGFKAAHPCQLDVHHIDGAHTNNAPDNLRTLCANCHRLEHWAPALS